MCDNMPASFMKKRSRKKKGGVNMFTDKKEQVLNTMCCRMLISRACTMTGAFGLFSMRLLTDRC